MVKSTWLRGLLRAGKKQQKVVARVVKNLLATPKAGPKAKPRTRLTASPKAKPPVKAKLPVEAEPPVKVKPPVKAKLRAPAVKSAAAKRTLARAPRKLAEARVTPPPPAPGKWLASYFTGLPAHGGAPLRRMHYWLYLPEDSIPPPASGRPLIVMLHGCDQSATQFAEGTRMNQLAGRLGYAVLYPQQALGHHPHRCWKWYERATQNGGGDVAMITGIVEQVAARYPIDRARIYIGGMSAGAGMAHIVALNHPHMFAALGLHSGPAFGAGHSAVGALTVMQRGAGLRVDSAIADVLARHPDGLAGLPTILIQGDADTVVRPVNQDQLMRQAMLVNQLPAGAVEAVVQMPAGRRGHAYQLRDVVRKRKLVLRVARIAGLPHAWSGGDARLAFNAAAGPDASKMLLNFFGRHRRSG